MDLYQDERFSSAADTGANEQEAIFPTSDPHISIVSSPVEDSPVHTEYASTSSQFSCRKFAVQRLPILGWIPKYKPRRDLLPDVVSGVTVGLTAIPQSIAYANVAGLTPEYGLYSSFIASFVYIFLGSCRQMTIGPTALIELLVFETCGQDFPSCVILTGFWVGAIQVAMGLLRLGAVVSLISDPVTIGFVGGASLTICSSQIRSFLGLSGPKGSGFLGYLRSAIENINTITLGDTLLGICCVIFLLVCKNLKDYVKPINPKIARLFWFLSLSRNAMVVIFASVLAASLTSPPFALTGTVKSGFPEIAPPSFLLPESANSTIILTFPETWSFLGTAPLMIAIISILQNVAIAKAFGSGQSIDATQEMFALGASHLLASFFSAMPTAGSFTRSAVNEASGVRSPFGGIFTGLLVIFALSFLTRWFTFIPKASLAAVILCAVLPMIEYSALRPMWQVSKMDVLTTLVTFFASVLLGMEYGIVIGVTASLAIYLSDPARPRVAWSLVAADNLAYLLIKPEHGFQFPSVDALRTLINKKSLQHPDVQVICLDCENVIRMDYTSASALSSLVTSLRKAGKELVFLKCSKEWMDMMGKVGLKRGQVFGNSRDVQRWINERKQELP